MKNCEREAIKSDYIENVYKRSWTYERLTDKEKSKIIDLLYSAKLFANTKKDVCYEMHVIYSAFLEALDYAASGWREPDKEYKNNLF